MANTTETMTSLAQPSAPSRAAIVFGGETRNMAMGGAMVGAAVAAFVSGLTSTFFTQALAWTFLAWGVFFLYGDLLLSTRQFIVTDDGIEIKIPFRFWHRDKVWAWKDISRLDIVIDQRSTHVRETALQVYHQFPGEVSLDREDRNFDPELAGLIIERARLKADSVAANVTLSDLPLGKSVVLSWKR